MHNSKEEKERRYYNRKLMKDTFKAEAKRPYKLDWKEIIVTVVGVILGCSVSDAIGIETLIHNTVVSFIIELIIVMASIFIVDVIAGVLKKLRR